MHEMCIQFYEFEGDLSTTHFLHLSRGRNESEPTAKYTYFTENRKQCTSTTAKEEWKVTSMTTTAKIITEKRLLSYDNNRIEHLNFDQRKMEIKLNNNTPPPHSIRSRRKIPDLIHWLVCRLKTHTPKLHIINHSNGSTIFFLSFAVCKNVFVFFASLTAKLL